MALDGIGDWRRALPQTEFVLRPYADYLRTAIEAAKRTKPCLAWRLPTEGEREALQARLEKRAGDRRRPRVRRERRRDRINPRAVASGVWVLLESTPERPEESEKTFDTFLRAKDVHDHPNCQNANLLKVVGWDREANALLLGSPPQPWSAGDDELEIRRLWIRPNTYPLECQRRALDRLRDGPTPRLAPLVRLASSRPTWPVVRPVAIEEDHWAFLRSDDGRLRDGTTEQRRFVSIALGTPDFAFLEGPPGSGKTTAICELIAQTLASGSRVLLVASTHVAVDNVLERLIEWQDEMDEEERVVLPVRVGDEERVTSDVLRPFTLERLLRTWRAELLDFLDDPGAVEEAAATARATLRAALGDTSESSTLSRLILDSSNLVCGTTIGPSGFA
jgi:hypothetical protein